MDYEKMIIESMRGKIGEFVVTNREGEIVYRNHAERFEDKSWSLWMDINIDRENIAHQEIWEVSDKKSGNAYRVLTVPVTQEPGGYLVHHVYNTSDYANLLRDVSGYSKEWRKLSDVQTTVLERISGSYQDCMEVILRTLDVQSAVLYIEREKCVERYEMGKGDTEAKMTRLPEGIWSKRGDRRFLPGFGTKGFLCFIDDKTVDGTRFALYLNVEQEQSEEPFQMEYNVIRLFVENALMREQIVYESEHDQLTGLFNKGKYLSMMEEFFPTCKRIAIYNMDVNYLKRTNDTYGHEAGDALIVKAAKSLLAVERENVRGYRMGGDEFMLIGWDLEEAEAEQVKSEWEEALRKLNEEDAGGIECVIACGLAYGGGGHDLQELLKTADERMYENKVAIKKARGDDPDAR